MDVNAVVKSFFKESKEQSRVKSEIVAKYLWVWSQVMIPSAKKGSKKIGYIDLFAGPGRYEDGTKSTPLLILERAVNDTNMRDMLVTSFNDADHKKIQSLQHAINSIPNIAKLKFQPKVSTEIVQEEMAEEFEQTRLIPCLTFLDPWGYKGLSCRLINSVIKDWGCECIIFFNYNRINMGLGNQSVKEHVNALFGSERADELRQKITSLSPSDREITILEALSQALKDMGAQYLLPFRFRGSQGNRISHHLIFITKHLKGYEIMKEIMARESSTFYQGVPSYEYSPIPTVQPYLLPPSQPIDKLKAMLLKYFKGQCLTVLEIYHEHNKETLYIKTNYKKALLELENEGRITALPIITDRRKFKGEATLGDKVKVTFP